MPKPDYSEQRQDPRWQMRRLKIMERDGAKCRDCNDGTKMLNVHHRYYVSGRMVWEYPDFCLVTLCEKCHKDRHDIDRTEPDAPPWAKYDEWEAVANALIGPEADSPGALWDAYCAASMMMKDHGIPHSDITAAIVEGLCRLWVNKVGVPPVTPISPGAPWCPFWLKPLE